MRIENFKADLDLIKNYPQLGKICILDVLASVSKKDHF
jgi:hypothetical protein